MRFCDSLNTLRSCNIVNEYRFYKTKKKFKVYDYVLMIKTPPRFIVFELHTVR